jgi:multiple sugar transport system permease protein
MEDELAVKSKETTHRWQLTMRRKEAIWFYIIISPWVIGFVLFTAGPILASIYLSFTEWDLFNAPVWVGLKNFNKLLNRDRVFGKTLYNTFFYALTSVPLNMVISLFFAYLLNKRLRGMSFFRTLFYMPAVVPVVAASMLFMRVLAPDTGLLNTSLALVGIDGPAWLVSKEWVKPALVIMSMWGVGGGIVLLLAGMRGISTELYEAAAIDGANERRQFFSVTLPLLSPVIFFNVVMGVIGSLQTCAQVYIMTSGGPNHAVI